MIHIYENVTIKPITLCANIKKKRKKLSNDHWIFNGELNAHNVLCSLLHIDFGGFVTLCCFTNQGNALGTAQM